MSSEWSKFFNEDLVWFAENSAKEDADKAIAELRRRRYQYASTHLRNYDSKKNRQHLLGRGETKTRRKGR